MPQNSSSNYNRPSGGSKPYTYNYDDPDDHDIEAFYDDYRDIYDNYDDAYDDFEDDFDDWKDEY